LSRTTVRFTHLTSSDVDGDGERDYLIHNLQKTEALSSVEVVNGFHENLEGKNRESVDWRTDGRLFVGVVAESLSDGPKPQGQQ
jgi:hypothetical protein